MLMDRDKSTCNRKKYIVCENAKENHNIYIFILLVMLVEIAIRISV